MKFTYWSGNRAGAEAELRKRENDLESFASEMGYDPSKVKVMFNYKEQTNESKRLRNLGYDSVERIERADVKVHKNGMVSVRVNDKAVRSKAYTVAEIMTNLNQVTDETVFAEIAVGVVAEYLAYNRVESNINSDNELYNEMEEDPFGVLVPMFIASYFKTRRFIDDMRVVNDPYIYANMPMKENDWFDLFDICNYHRIVNNCDFQTVMNDRYEYLNSKINKIISHLEVYLDKYINKFCVRDNNNDKSVAV